MDDQSSREVPIIAEDPFYWLINKPAGLLTQAPQGITSVETTLCEQIRVRDSHPGAPFIGLPHRLDRSTSGAMLIARNQRSLARFGLQFQSRKINKFYIALLSASAAEARLPSEKTRWSDFVRKVPDRPFAEVAAEGEPGAKLAELDIRILASAGDKHLALIQLLTGRMHQIRIQAATRKMAVVGDTLYEQLSAADRAAETEYESSQEIALHSLRLEFRHPKTAKQMSATADLPPTWPGWAGQLQQQSTELVERSTGEFAAWQL